MGRFCVTGRIAFCSIAGASALKPYEDLQRKDARRPSRRIFLEVMRGFCLLDNEGIAGFNIWLNY